VFPSERPKKTGEAPRISTSEMPSTGRDTIRHVPIEINEHVKNQLDLFQYRIRERFGVWLARSGRYMSVMQEIFRNHGLPEELVFLALIESGFNPQAYSPAAAVGPWQFIKQTAQQYGLKVNQWIDERRDPIKSTMAAARYLKDLYGRFQSWTLSIASYNAGEGRVQRAIEAMNTLDFWSLKQGSHLKEETKNYVPKFMAATLIGKNPSQYGFHIAYQQPLAYEEVVVRRQTPLTWIAKASGVSTNQIRGLNPELRRDVTPPGSSAYRVKLPVGTKQAFLKFSKTTSKPFDQISKISKKHPKTHVKKVKKIVKKGSKKHPQAHVKKERRGLHRGG